MTDITADTAGRYDTSDIKDPELLSLMAAYSANRLRRRNGVNADRDIRNITTDILDRASVDNIDP